MRILIITDTLWRNDNNVGNSYSNIFEGIDDLEIYNICCQQGKSSNTVIKSSFQISEKSIIRSFFGKKSGYYEQDISINIDNSLKNSNILRLQIFFWIRELIWFTNKWKSKELDSYLEEVSPDLIFVQLADKTYINRISLYAKKKCVCPIVGYTWDDIYTLKQFSLSPLYWIDRFIKRCSLRKIVNKCKIIYTISEIQKDEYSNIFNKKCHVLYKGYNIDRIENCCKSTTEEIRFLYTGNIGDYRWKSLQLLASSLEKYSKATLDIYTATPLKKKITNKFKKFKNTNLYSKVSNEKVSELQSEADVLVHVEPLGLKGMLKSRLSFSTKIVDYFFKKKCILAIGSSESASINYLIKNDAALVATNNFEIDKQLNLILENHDICDEYAEKGYYVGITNHNINIIQNKLIDDFKKVIYEN
ncbi:hypothetical protein [Thomasclavelia sp.]